MATAVATTSADRASASEIRPSETVCTDRTRDLEHWLRRMAATVSHVDRIEFLREAKLMNKKLKRC